MRFPDMALKYNKQDTSACMGKNKTQEHKKQELRVSEGHLDQLYTEGCRVLPDS